MSADRHDHWQAVWANRDPEQLSWHQDSAKQSFDLITASLDGPNDAIIDAGGGDSPLAGELLRYGFTDLTVLDISEAALADGRRRLGPLADTVTWVVDDVTSVQPQRTYRLWHDRAMFHFLTSDADRGQYADAAATSVAPGGWLIIATFALDGPEQCSGLPVQRHSPASLTQVFAPDFSAVDFAFEAHVAPSGALQRFTYGRFRRS